MDNVTAERILEVDSRQKPTARRRAAKLRQDPRLTFILAHQTILRWQLAAQRLQRPVRIPSEGTALRIEAELGLGQLQAVSERVRPLTRLRDLAVRFEAEELMVRLGELEAQLLRSQQTLAIHSSAPRRTARELAETLMAKARSLSRR